MSEKHDLNWNVAVHRIFRAFLMAGGTNEHPLDSDSVMIEARKRLDALKVPIKPFLKEKKK
jgi:hypothetical protein